MQQAPGISENPWKSLSTYPGKRGEGQKRGGDGGGEGDILVGYGEVIGGLVGGYEGQETGLCTSNLHI